ncbi:11236_t:CDS:1 [Dentiscutata erythropus]|uniref:11236_t:CDS:1 n=1 Tax=Dentiscutata erythropus TaxID=1348616 RepID=A0A9N9G4E8_9GLOM|nr:11236_t:CDS:1 [Dentiscutata erythropus]
MAVKDDVTFNELIANGFFERNKDYIKKETEEEKKKDEKANVIDLSKPEYDVVSNDDTCKKIYVLLANRRAYKVKEELDDSNIFAAWLFEGRRESLENENKLKAPSNIIGMNRITYFENVRPLFTECDEWNMRNQQKRPGIDIQLWSYDNVKTNYDKILARLKARNMPPGAPWSDEQINTFIAWGLDGKPDAEVLSPIRPYYPGIEISPDKLNFDQHISILFTEGHHDRMIEHKVDRSKYSKMRVDLQDYESVKYHKKNILDRLTFPTKDKRMPKFNPWPIKNVKLFHAWAAQGEEPLRDSTPADTKPYSKGAQELIDMQGYVDRYMNDPDAPKE